MFLSYDSKAESKLFSLLSILTYRLYENPVWQLSAFDTYVLLS